MVRPAVSGLAGLATEALSHGASLPKAGQPGCRGVEGSGWGESQRSSILESPNRLSFSLSLSKRPAPGVLALNAPEQVRNFALVPGTPSAPCAPHPAPCAPATHSSPTFPPRCRGCPGSREAHSFGGDLAGNAISSGVCDF